MDNNNNTNQNINQEPVPVVPPPIPEGNAQVSPVQPQPETAKVSPKESIKIRIEEVKNKLGFNDPVKKKRAIIIVAVLVLILVLIMLGSVLIPKQVATPLATITPTPIGTEQPRGEPSEYSEDPEVLRIRDAIMSFDEKAKNTVLREDNLRLPTVDWNVSF